MSKTLSPPDPVLLSWSGLKRWEACPQHQLRVIRHETEKSNMGRIFLDGTVTDLTMRAWLDNGNPLPGQMEQMVEDWFAETLANGEHKIHWRGDPEKDKQKAVANCKKAVKNLEPWLTEHVLPYDYCPEVKFKANMTLPYVCDGGKAPLQMIGGIDILVRDDQHKFHIYDLKMTTGNTYLKATLGQLTYYDIAWSVIQGSFDSCVEWGLVTPIHPDQLYLPVSVTDDERQKMLSRIHDYAQGVWRDEWAPKSDDTGCDYCPARKWCDKFKPVPIEENNGKMKLSFAQAAEQRSKFR